MNQSLVSIIIPTHNRKDMLLRLLKSILASTYKNIEIIVIDDASNDGTFEFIKERFNKNKKIQIIRNKTNLFTAGSRNEGFKHVKGDYVFFIDDDNVLDKNAISSFINLFKKDPTIGELGPVNYSCANRKKILWSGTNRNMFTTLTNQSRDIKKFGKLESWETDDVPNAFMVKADIVKKNKIYFKKYYGIMYEESDYAYRIRNLGYSIKVVKDAKIYHDVEEYVEGKMTKDYMYHFMEDMRRPYVFARNRIIFHFLYSNKLQNIGILCFWIWVFSAYYCHKFIFYKGYGNFDIKQKFLAALSYIKGTISGLNFVFFSTHKI